MARKTAEIEPLQRRRTEVVTVRLDPRLKYLAEVAARKQRRTLSGYIEWAVERSLAQVFLHEGERYDGQRESVSVEDAERVSGLWDVDEVHRVTTLAFNYPELLTYDEQLIWRLVRDCGLVWAGGYNGPGGCWQWSIESKKLIWERLREHWDTFKKVAAGALPRDKLPTWRAYKPKDTTKSNLDDEIPF